MINIIDFKGKVAPNMISNMENYKSGVIEQLYIEITICENDYKKNYRQDENPDRYMDDEDYQYDTSVSSLKIASVFSDLNPADKKYLCTPIQGWNPESEMNFFYYSDRTIVSILKQLDLYSFFYASYLLVNQFKNSNKRFERTFCNIVYKLIKYWNLEKYWDYIKSSKSVFIAMSFGEEMKTAREAIRAAILHFNWEPVFIDEKEHCNFIVPEIIAEIKTCLFMISDFTENKAGVYYEAGIGEGLNKTVIYTCKNTEADKDKLHFDIKQINTIFWDDIDDLKKKLICRIDTIKMNFK